MPYRETRDVKVSRKNWIFLFFAFLCPFFTGTLMAAQVPADTYMWSGELVSLDEVSDTVTLKARIAGAQPMIELPKFKPGDRILLTWAVQAALNGPGKYADAISYASPYDGRNKPERPFTFASEFVAFDPVHQFVTFKTVVGPDTVGRIKSLNSGEYIVATSPIRQSAASEFIVVQPQNPPSSSSSN